MKKAKEERHRCSVGGDKKPELTFTFALLPFLSAGLLNCSGRELAFQLPGRSGEASQE